MTDFYSILGLEKSASLRDIKAAYRVLAKKYHPDVNKSAAAARQMQSVNEAYETLGDPIKRAEYDQIREMGGGSAQVASEQSVHVACKKCGKVDSTLRVSTFTTVWSFVFFSTYRGWSQILCAKCRVLESLKFNLQVLFFGWWGIPWGIIWTIVFFIKNAMGGHQPRENNAVLLATVGKNLIDAGDYIEAEKALIESLKLKDNKYVQDLLRTAKSRAGFKKEKSNLEKMARFESHPLMYNILLAVLFILISVIIIKSIDITYSNSPQSSATSSKIKANLFQRISSKINLSKGEQWSLPVHLGDSRSHILKVLGVPENFYGAECFDIQKNNSLVYENKGISVFFQNDVATIIHITWMKNQFLKQLYTGFIVYGVKRDSSLAVILSKLGTPNSTEKNDDEYSLTWDFGNLRINCYYNEKDTSFIQNIYISDLMAIKREEQEKQAENDKVKLNGEKLTPKEIFNKYRDRIYTVVSYNSKKKAYCTGTAFLYSDAWGLRRYLVTNYHVVENAHFINVTAIDNNKDQEFDPNQDTRVELANPKQDWVVLSFFDKTNANKMPAVEISNNSSPGESITVIGNPEGLSGSLSTGVVSGTREEGETRMIQITAPISHGSSGSPVFDETGHWIGLATLYLEDSQNLNFAIPSKIIKDAILSWEKKNGEPKTLPLSPGINDNDEFNSIVKEDSKIETTIAARENNITKLKKLLKRYQDPDDKDQILDEIQNNICMILSNPQAISSNQTDYIQRKTVEALKLNDYWISLDDKNYKPLQAKGDIYQLINNADMMKELYQQAIRLAADKINNDFEDNKIKYKKSQHPDDDEITRKSNLQSFNTDNNQTTHEHGSDALAIGIMYYKMYDDANSIKWFERAKEWSYIDQLASKYLDNVKNGIPIKGLRFSN